MAYGTVNADVISTSVANTSLGAGNATRFKNRIINGDMRIDQRNAGASVTLNAANNVYPTDRFASFASVGTVTGQQSTSAPSGFINSIVYTVSATGSLGTTGTVRCSQYIEGLNVSDLGWGTVDAKTVTLSFWVKSSLTGTFGGSIRNSANDRCYVFSYTISSANTWTQISITVAGDTTGTWLTTNGVGIRVFWSLGSGSSYQGTAGSWGTSLLYSVTGETTVVTNLGATFYITGVQLEIGSSATGFEYLDYGTELIMCQRYYELVSKLDLQGYVQANKQAYINTSFVPKRTSPTIASASTSNADNTTNFGSNVTLSNTDNQHMVIQLIGNNGGLNYCRLTCNNFSYSAEL